LSDQPDDARPPSAAPDAEGTGRYVRPAGEPGSSRGFLPPDSRPGRNPLGIAALLLGIVSLPAAFVPDLDAAVALVALALGIVGWARAGRRGLSRGSAVAGTILATVGLAGTIVVALAQVHASDVCKGIVTNPRTYSTCRKKNFDP
jgi:hypothetical protein